MARFRCVRCGLVVEVSYSWWPDKKQGGECPAVESNGNHGWILV